MLCSVDHMRLKRQGRLQAAEIGLFVDGMILDFHAQLFLIMKLCVLHI